MNIALTKLSPNNIEDFISLISVFEDVFEWETFPPPSRLHLQKVLSNPTFIALVAKADEKVVGGLTAYVLESYQTEKPSVYIYDVAVATSSQRQEIGKKLIAFLIEYCQQNGFQEAFVQAEKADTHAINFYRKTPISSELQATHFTYSFDQ